MMHERDQVDLSSVEGTSLPAALLPSLLADGFLPAFRHQGSGETHLCRASDGAIADVHRLDSLPNHWVSERDRIGQAAALVAAVEAGFLRGHEFWTLGDLIRPRLDG